MSRTLPVRKRHPGPDLGPAPGERGFAKWLRASIAGTEKEIAEGGTVSLSEAKRLVRQRRSLPAQAPKKRSIG